MKVDWKASFEAAHEENTELMNENDTLRHQKSLLANEILSQDKELNDLYEKVDTLFDAIKHGDEAHQAWLKDAIEKHMKGAE